MERWGVRAMEYRPDEVNGPKGLGRIAQARVGLAQSRTTIPAVL